MTSSKHNSPFTSHNSALTTHASLFSIPRCSRGQALVEYAIIFPVQLMLVLAIIQLAHIFVAKQVLEYSAFCGARAALVDSNATRAACIPISGIAGTSGVGSGGSIDVPGWGILPRSRAAEEKTLVDVRQISVDGSDAILCTVLHDYELRVPVGNYVAYQVGSVFLSSDALDYHYGAPHMQIRASCALAKP